MWIKEGWITLTDGVVEDYSSITEYIMKSAEKEGWLIKEVCIDLYKTTQFGQEIMDEGYLAVEIRQGWKTRFLNLLSLEKQFIPSVVFVLKICFLSIS